MRGMLRGQEGALREVVLGTQEGAEGWEKVDGVGPVAPLQKSEGLGTWSPGPAHSPGDPSAEQRGTAAGVDPSPAACLLPGARLLVCLHLPSSVTVSRGPLTCPPPLLFMGNYPAMPSQQC